MNKEQSGWDEPTTHQVGRVLRLLHDVVGRQLTAVYLYGSTVAGGLKPASDIDLFAVTHTRTTEAQRRWLIGGLRPLSARDARPVAWRPVELTIVAQPDLDPWRYPPRLDFQSGEWLRERFDAADPQPWRTPNPDLAIAIAQVRESGTPLLGPPAKELLPEIHVGDLRRAMSDELPSLLDDLETDTANVLLTLARIWHTLVTQQFVSKDAAADWVLGRLSAADGAPLARARDVYLGLAPGSWQEQEAWAHDLPAARLTAGSLVRQIESMSGP